MDRGLAGPQPMGSQRVRHDERLSATQVYETVLLVWAGDCMLFL